MTAILRSRYTFLPIAIPKIDYAIKIAKRISYILCFDQCSRSNIDGAMAVQNFDLF